MSQLGMKYTSSTPLDYWGNKHNLIKVNINGEDKEYCVISESQETESWYDDEPFHLFQTHSRVYTYELVEFVKVKVKTKEEIAAEESVVKAKEALKAAENALKVVKEGK